MTSQYGLIERDWQSFPEGCKEVGDALPDSFLIPRNEWQERFDEMRANRSGLLDLRKANYEVLKSLNQNPKKLCWAFSSTKATMYVNFKSNNPAGKKRLSAWYVAGKVRNWKDAGYWGAASLQFIREHGACEESFCPSYNRKYDTEEAAENALNYRVTEWWDGSKDPDKAQAQAVSMFLVGLPCVIDLTQVMGHSMCGIDLESVDPVKFIYDNSWGTDDTPDGLFRGKGLYAKPNGLVIPRVTTA